MSYPAQSLPQTPMIPQNYFNNTAPPMHNYNQSFAARPTPYVNQTMMPSTFRPYDNAPPGFRQPFVMPQHHNDIPYSKNKPILKKNKSNTMPIDNTSKLSFHGRPSLRELSLSNNTTSENPKNSTPIVRKNVKEEYSPRKTYHKTINNDHYFAKKIANQQQSESNGEYSTDYNNNNNNNNSSNNNNYQQQSKTTLHGEYMCNVSYSIKDGKPNGYSCTRPSIVPFRLNPISVQDRLYQSKQECEIACRTILEPAHGDRVYSTTPLYLAQDRTISFNQVVFPYEHEQQQQQHNNNINYNIDQESDNNVDTVENQHELRDWLGWYHSDHTTNNGSSNSNSDADNIQSLRYRQTVKVNKRPINPSEHYTEEQSIPFVGHATDMDGNTGLIVNKNKHLLEMSGPLIIRMAKLPTMDVQSDVPNFYSGGWSQRPIYHGDIVQLVAIGKGTLCFNLGSKTIKLNTNSTFNDNQIFLFMVRKIKTGDIRTDEDPSIRVGDEISFEAVQLIPSSQQHNGNTVINHFNYGGLFLASSATTNQKGEKTALVVSSEQRPFTYWDLRTRHEFVDSIKTLEKSYDYGNADKIGSHYVHHPTTFHTKHDTSDIVLNNHKNNDNNTDTYANYTEDDYYDDDYYDDDDGDIDVDDVELIYNNKSNTNPTNSIVTNKQNSIPVLSQKNNDQSNEQQKRPPNQYLPFIGLGTIILLLVGANLYFASRNKKDNKKANRQQTVKPTRLKSVVKNKTNVQARKSFKPEIVAESGVPIAVLPE